MTRRARSLALLAAFVLSPACGGGGTPRDDTTGPDRFGADVVGDGQTQPPPSRGSRPPTAEEQEAMDRLFAVAEQVRNLRFIRPVPILIQDADAITERLTAEMEEEDLEKARIVYAALGLLPEDTDVRELLERVLGEQVVGYYDTDNHRLAVREDMARALRRESRSTGSAAGLAEGTMTLVHEMVHALQDQHMNLHAMREIERDSDPGGAFMAVVEGDATLAMLGYGIEAAGGRLDQITRNPGVMRSLISQTPSFGGGELGSSPAILRYTLVSPYLDGVMFAATLHGRGGWRAVDRAFAQLPQTTEQVLHPERYYAGELSDPVAIPPLPPIEAAGWTMLEEDSLGELEMAVYFGQGMADEIDRPAAEGWGGDRLRVYRAPSGGTGAGMVVWFTSWDDEAQAREAESAARRVMDGASGAQRPTFYLERTRRAVLILRNCPAQLQDAPKTAFRAWAQALPPTPPRANTAATVPSP